MKTLVAVCSLFLLCPPSNGWKSPFNHFPEWALGQCLVWCCPRLLQTNLPQSILEPLYPLLVSATCRWFGYFSPEPRLLIQNWASLHWTRTTPYQEGLNTIHIDGNPLNCLIFQTLGTTYFHIIWKFLPRS